MEQLRQPVATHGNGLRLSEPFWASSHLPPVATSCNRWAPQRLHPLLPTLTTDVYARVARCLSLPLRIMPGELIRLALSDAAGSKDRHSLDLRLSRFSRVAHGHHRRPGARARGGAGRLRRGGAQPPSLPRLRREAGRPPSAWPGLGPSSPGLCRSAKGRERGENNQVVNDCVMSRTARHLLVARRVEDRSEPWLRG
jgi:hypothetical protein